MKLPRQNSSKNLKLFDTGPSVTLEEMLNHREQRMLFQKALYHRYPGEILITVGLNIPGPIKYNELIEQVFTKAYGEVIAMCDSKGWNLSHNQIIKVKTGIEAFMVVQETVPIDIKQAMLTLEEKSPTGRLLDLDVSYGDKTEGTVKQVNRQILGYPDRPCFLCEDAAKACGRSKKHELTELYSKLEDIVAG